jgi:peptide-methionine (S)-S-oxide reductase
MVLLLAAAVLASGATAFAQPAGRPAENGLQTAVFAGGCFWCVEEAFDTVEGVVETTSGYIGGTVPNPTYKQVTAGNTGHAEAVQVRYDPAKVGYARLLDVFWRNVDPLDAGGQFCDRGSSYRSAIFFTTADQERLARTSKKQIAERLRATVATEIVPAGTFYPAESYHQNYHAENPLKYKFYKWNCGRAQRLDELWGKPSS